MTWGIFFWISQRPPIPVGLTHIHLTPEERVFAIFSQGLLGFVLKIALRRAAALRTERTTGKRAVNCSWSLHWGGLGRGGTLRCDSLRMTAPRCQGNAKAPPGRGGRLCCRHQERYYWRAQAWLVSEPILTKAKQMRSRVWCNVMAIHLDAAGLRGARVIGPNGSQGYGRPF